MGNVAMSNDRYRLATRRRPALELLESRECMAVESIAVNGATLVIQADDAATRVSVQSAGSEIVIVDQATAQSWRYASAGVAALEFHGGAANDRFENSVARLRVWASGNGGDDILRGNAAADTLLGGEGSDQLQGGAGADTLRGGPGDDILIAIDNGIADQLFGDEGCDTMWVDRNGAASDVVIGVEATDVVQKVDRFNNSADRTLDADNIADPKLKGKVVYRRFANLPLFSSAGPQPGDARQGLILGDCWLIAGLSAIAADSPATIRQNMVDFQDGTYGVRLGDKFYRVDADLPVAKSGDTTPDYAALGVENSIWVAAAEKAFAHYRTGKNTYASTEYGWSIEVYKAFRFSSSSFKELTSYANAVALAADLQARFNNQESVTLGIVAVKRGMQANPSLVLAHMYSVASIDLDADGNVTSIVLRNPWGFDGRAGNSEGDPNDGLVRITPTQLMAYTGRLNWGRV